MELTKTTKEIPFVWQSTPPKSDVLTVHSFVWTKPLATQKGLMWFGATWAMAIIAVFIPIVHFVAVPVLLLAGPLMGRIIYKMYLNQIEWEPDPLTCPACQTVINVRFDEEKPQPGSCAGCQLKYTFS